MANTPSLFHCPTCGQVRETLCTDSRPTTTGRRRRRECQSCHSRFTTFEPAGGAENLALLLAEPVKPAEKQQITFGRKKGRSLRVLRRYLVQSIYFDLRFRGGISPATVRLRDSIRAQKAAGQ